MFKMYFFPESARRKLLILLGETPETSDSSTSEDESVSPRSDCVINLRNYIDTCKETSSSSSSDCETDASETGEKKTNKKKEDLKKKAAAASSGNSIHEDSQNEDAEDEDGEFLVQACVKRLADFGICITFL